MQNLSVARNSCEIGYFWDSRCASPKCLIPFVKTLLHLCVHADLCDYIKEQKEFLVNKTSTYKIPQISFGICSEIGWHIFSWFLAVKKRGSRAALLPSAYLCLHYCLLHNNRSGHNEADRNPIASTESLWHWKDHSTPHWPLHRKGDVMVVSFRTTPRSMSRATLPAHHLDIDISSAGSDCCSLSVQSLAILAISCGIHWFLNDASWATNRARQPAFPLGIWSEGLHVCRVQVFQDKISGVCRFF